MSYSILSKLRWAAVVALVVAVQAGSVYAGDYRIGARDVLQVSFWQDPNLSSQVEVSVDGKITLDIIGEISAAGKTTTELQTEIVRKIGRFNKKISQATVRVVAYNYQHVFVTGQVRLPGKLAFEAIPDLWTIINEAGGILGSADLTRVTIIRGGENAGKVEVINLAGAIASGNLDNLPKIGRQDTIEIPRTPGGIPSADLADRIDQRNVIYVVGAVMTPGPQKFDGNIDVMEALALAGGPTPNANLKKASVITKDGYYAQTVRVNLRRYYESGKPARYIVRKEDIVFVPVKGTNIFGVGLGTVAGFLGVITTSLILYDRLKGDDAPVAGAP